MPRTQLRWSWPCALLFAVACGASAHPDDAQGRGRRSGGSHARADSGSPSGSHSMGMLSRYEQPPVDARVTAEPSLSVLSYNVNFGVGHDPVNAEVIARAAADVVLLQETTDDSEALFREQLGETYAHALFRPCCRAGGLGVLSRHPIVDEQYLEPTVGWFPAWRVVIDTPQLGRVQLLDVHLRPPVDDEGSWVGGYFSTRDTRRQEIEAFWTAIDPGLPTVVAGDFNENASGRAIAFLAEQGLRTAWAELAPRTKTWQWQTKVGTIHAQLDHVVYGAPLAARSARVLQGGHSDHLPVLVELGLAAPPQSTLKW